MAGARSMKRPLILLVARYADRLMWIRFGSRVAGSGTTKGPRHIVSGPSGFGGAREDRTPDLYNAIVALSQLSYGPGNWVPRSPEAPAVGSGSALGDQGVLWRRPGRRRDDQRSVSYASTSSSSASIGARSSRSEEHTSELQSLLRNPYAVFCLKKK